jgi:hypothetical protein
VRRLVPPRDAGGIPEHLVLFDVEDWPDPGPQPPGWDDSDGVGWREVKAWLAFINARREWRREQRMGLEEFTTLTHECGTCHQEGRFDDRA